MQKSGHGYWLLPFLLFLTLSCTQNSFFPIPWTTTPNPNLGPLAEPADFGFPVPNPEPTLPSGVDIYQPPSLETKDTGPLIAEMLRTAGADETFTLAGENFSSGMKFEIFSQTISSDRATQSVAPLYTNTRTASTTVPGGLPWAMYLVWPHDGDVRGKAFALNRTEGWWVGPKKAIAGQTISIFGRNLSYGNGTSTSYVYVKPANAEGSWVTPTTVNPYKVDFVVPNLAAGTYELWIHNGHGGRFGWSGPLTLNVLATSPWAGVESQTFNVKNAPYNAVGDGVTDDSVAIRNAIIAAGNSGAPATVYLPAGTYAVSESFFLPAKTRLLGAGRDVTSLKMTIPLPTENGFIKNIGSGIVIEGIEIDADGMIAANGEALIYMSVNDLKIINSRLKSRGGKVFEVGNGCNNILLDGVDFVGAGSFWASASQVFINNTTFRLTNDAESGVSLWGGREIALTNNDFSNFDETQADGHGIGRMFVSQGHFGSLRNAYFSGNASHNYAPRDCNFVDCNMGEQILFEFGGGEYKTAATAVGASSVTFASVTSDPTTTEGGLDITITSGKGLGQHRRVVSVAAGVVTVDRAWTIAPDASSKFLINAVSEKTVVYNNTFQGRTTHSTHDSASTAVNVFGSSVDAIVDKNTISRMRHGLMIVTHVSNMAGNGAPLYFSLTANNTITDGNNGIYTGMVYGYDSSLDWGAIGNVFRGNTINGMTNMGIAFDQWDSAGGNIDSHIFEKNVLTNVHYGLISALKVIWETGTFDSVPMNGTKLTGTVLRSNSISRGSAVQAGSIGFRTEAASTWINRATTFQGFNSGNTGP
ncbi:hypothetical protein AZI86_02090 [Bdellovibrio bacteriovorus]|uniref:Uncharacterized protein n=1 Tax=Bdellovibrio bacteriovorus TaxID=959 RepID=A0A150WNF3_BDEBC|nr:glycosyl hydrolase family 28-related protein [Bdellovibrio bacteriovorus]KYG65886.1 hypothetical protein AZI86_02090 [Bdellovibrio bacteriovorus]